MSWIRIWVHVVFSTKNRYPYLKTKEIRFKFFQHIKENALEKEIYLDCVNGYTDHAHCLVSLRRGQNISKIAQLIKGEASIWINRQDFITDHFAWQDDYWAVGVSESHVEAVRKYIHNQEEHHQAKSFSKETNNFMKKYGWKPIRKRN